MDDPTVRDNDCRCSVIISPYHGTSSSWDFQLWNACPNFHAFAASEWLIQRLETMVPLFCHHQPLPWHFFLMGLQPGLQLWIYWDGTVLWSFIKLVPRVLYTKSVHTCKLHDLYGKARSVHAHT